MISSTTLFFVHDMNIWSMKMNTKTPSPHVCRIQLCKSLSIILDQTLVPSCNVIISTFHLFLKSKSVIAGSLGNNVCHQMFLASPPGKFWIRADYAWPRRIILMPVCTIASIHFSRSCKYILWIFYSLT